MVELHHLRTFLAVCKFGSVTRAARTLHTTPPTISARIKALEEALDVTLFDRTSKGMQLTEKGAALREKAGQVLQAEKDLVQAAADAKSMTKTRLSVGLNASSTFLRIARLVECLHAVEPGMTLSFTGSTTGRIIEALDEGVLDAGYLFGETAKKEITCHRLALMNLAVAAPLKWAAQIRQADWPDLAKLPWIASHGYCPFQEITDRLFVQRGLVLERTVQSDDELTKSELVRAGIGLALLESGEAVKGEQEGHMVVWRHGSAPIHCPLFFGHLEQRAKEPGIKALVGAVTQVWRDET